MHCNLSTYNQNYNHLSPGVVFSSVSAAFISALTDAAVISGLVVDFAEVAEAGL